MDVPELITVHVIVMTAAADNSLCDELIASLIKRYNITEGVFYRQLKRHSDTLFKTHIVPLMSISSIPELYCYQYFKLVISSYLLDSVMDFREREGEELARFLFVGMDLFADFKAWFANEFDESSMDMFDRYYYTQMEYQMIERSSNISEYSKLFPDYSNYWIKQCILYAPIQVFAKEGFFTLNSNEVENLYHSYYSLLLKIDDYMDVSIDLRLESLTPLQSQYFSLNGKLAEEEEELRPFFESLIIPSSWPIGYKRAALKMLNKCKSIKPENFE